MITLSEALSNFSGTTNYVAKYTPTGNVLGISQIFDNGTNVGIGTITPTSKLQIVGTDSTSSNYSLKIDNSASSPLLYVRNDKYVSLGNIISQSYVGLTTTKNRVFQIQYDANNMHSFEFWTDTTTSNSYIGCRADLEFWNTQNGKFLNYDSNIFSINTNDTILIAQSSIKGQGTTNGVLNGNNTSIQTGIQIGIYGSSKGISATNTNIGAKFTATGGLYNYGLIVEDGNVGIGALNPSEKLEVNGNIKTAQPSANGAGSWKLGKKVTATVSLVTTDYIEVEIDSVVYKLALVS